MQPIPKGQVPFYSELSDYAWVEEYRKLTKARDERREVMNEIKAIRKIPPDIGSLMQKVKASYDNYREERVQAIARLIERNRLSKNPLGGLRYIETHQLRGPLVQWAEVEAAFEYLGDKDTIADDERGKRLERLKAEISALDEYIVELSPQKYFKFNDGRVVCDMRDRFVEHWWGVQMWLCAACGPQKYELTASPSIEQAAHKLLGIDQYISKKTHKRPIPIH